MKTKQALLLALLAFSILRSALSTAEAQGSLTPPGAPGPTMITLTQIEPRTPISAPTNITASGSYYLTTNLNVSGDSEAIFITTSNVTIDLNGFALLGGGSGYGVSINSGSGNVTVRNGLMSGFFVGVASLTPNTVLEHLTVINCSDSGISIQAPLSVVRDCQCLNDGTSTIDSALGIFGGVVSGCVVVNNDASGIFLGAGSGSVSDCLVSSNAGGGIEVYSSGWQILGNTCVSNLDGNIVVAGNDNRIDGNHVLTSSASVGIDLFECSNNVVVRNTVCGGGSGNYIVYPNNDFGPIGAASNSTSPWANISH